MAYTNFTNKIIKQAWSVFDLTLAGTVSAGDLCTTAGVRAAAATAAAECIAMSNGVAGNVIKACIAAVVKKSETIGIGGVVTRGDHAGAAGVALYLGAAGAASESSGAIAQTVGWVLSQDEVMLLAKQYLTGVNISASGTCSVTGVLTAAGGITVSATKALVMAEANHTSNGAIATSGYATMSADNADLAMTLAAPTPGALLVIFDKANSGTKAHVVSAKAGSATFDGTNNSAKFDATAETLALVGLTTTRWGILVNLGAVGLSAT